MSTTSISVASEVRDTSGVTRRPRPPGTKRQRPEREEDSAQDILALITHELASPVVVIAGFAEALLAGAGEMNPDDRKALQAIQRAAAQIQSVLGRISDARSAEAGTLDIARAPVNLERLPNETVKDLAEELGARPVRIETDDDVVVQADEPLIRRLLADLIGNAVKFSPTGSPVSITVRDVPAGAEVSVSDRCGGIPQDERDKLFHPFARSRKAAGGLGLGLYISREVARAHGGDLTYEAIEEGGCRFVLRLPR